MRILCTADCGFHDSSGCCDIIMIGGGFWGVSIFELLCIGCFMMDPNQN